MKQLLKIHAFGAILLLLITSTHVYGQTVNIPPNHNSAGTLNPPVSCDPDEPGEVLWTIQNNSNCDLQYFFFFTVGENTYNLGLLSISAGSSVNITTGDLMQFVSSGNQPFAVTKASFQLNQGTETTPIGYGYPNSSERVTNPNLPAPCNCIHINWNQSTRTIVLSNC